MIIYRYSATCRIFTPKNKPMTLAELQSLLESQGLKNVVAETVYHFDDHGYNYCFFDFEIEVAKPFHEPVKYITERLINLHTGWLARLARKNRAPKILSSLKARLKLHRIEGADASNQTPTSPCDVCSVVYPMWRLKWNTNAALCICGNC